MPLTHDESNVFMSGINRYKHQDIQAVPALYLRQISIVDSCHLFVTKGTSSADPNRAAPAVYEVPAWDHDDVAFLILADIIVSRLFHVVGQDRYMHKIVP